MGQRITIEINKKIATCLTELPIVCGNSDYECEFVFDEEWDNHLIKTARFRVNGEYTDVVFEGNVCNMPIISNAKIVWIGVFAGELSTSTPAIVYCKPSILDGEDVPSPPREDVYSQIVELCEEAIETANSVVERANNGEFVGEKGEKGDPTEVAQNTGDSETAVMSQKATTNELHKVTSRLSNLERATKDVLYLDKTHTFTSGESFQFADALSYGRLDSIEGYHEYVRHRNLIPVPYNYYPSYTYNGVSFSFNNDNSISLNGDCTKSGVLWVVWSGMQWRPEPNVYYLSGCPYSGISNLRLKAINSDLATIEEWRNPVGFTICDLRGLDYTYLCLGIEIVGGAHYNNFTYKPQFELNGKTEFEGAGEFICEAPPTSVTMKNGGGKFFEYQISDELLQYLETKQLGYGLSGNRIDFQSKQYVRYTKPIYTDGKLTGAYPTETMGTAYNISKYLDDSSRYMFLSTTNNKVELFANDKLLQNAKCRVLMQHKIADTTEGD